MVNVKEGEENFMEIIGKKLGGSLRKYCIFAFLFRSTLWSHASLTIWSRPRKTTSAVPKAFYSKCWQPKYYTPKKHFTSIRTSIPISWKSFRDHSGMYINLKIYFAIFFLIMIPWIARIISWICKLGDARPISTCNF